MTGVAGPPTVELPPLAGALDTLWDLVLDIADRVSPDRWALIGGQMVMLHGLAAGRAPTRASRFAGSDRRRLLRLDRVLSDPEALEGRALGARAADCAHSLAPAPRLISDGRLPAGSSQTVVPR
jgi:hypothetical protein